MGFFSTLAMDDVLCAHDFSYIPPEQQLLWRLEDLESRLSELVAGEGDEGARFSENDLRYVLPEQFLSASDVRKAMDLAIRDLREYYGMYVDEQPRSADETIAVLFAFSTQKAYGISPRVA